MNLSDLTEPEADAVTAEKVTPENSPVDSQTAGEEDNYVTEAELQAHVESELSGSGEAVSLNLGLKVSRKILLKAAVAPVKQKPKFKKKEKSAGVESAAVETTPAKAPAAESAPAKEAEPVVAESVAAQPVAAEPAKAKTSEEVETFADLDLPAALQLAITESGYTKPSAIQAAIIPAMLEGRDVIAQSQTGSGKTAAFALPILANLKKGSRKASKTAGPAVLVLAPTRELAMQVAASIEKYAGDLKDFAVTAIYGGQDYMPQKRALRNGVSVVVGTPGRVIDHIRQGSLKIDNLQCLVLDEADEMLNMGFLEDVEFVLEQCPKQRQIALFSATMPDPIRRIADRYLTNPKTVTIKAKSMTAESIHQKAIFCGPREKTDLLCRVLEAEAIDGVIVFAKTKESTTVIADKLIKAGHSACALNGDMPQATRQRVVANLKSGKLDIIVATDVAARGLDVPRISHVINFDLPHDRESYVHRIGRTGRAGRKGSAILFLAPSARHRLRSIQQMTKQEIEIVEWPSVADINARRVEKFKEQITKTLATSDVAFFEKMVNEYMEESGQPIEKVAAALALIGKGRGPFLLTERVKPTGRDRGDRNERGSRDGRGGDRNSNQRGPRRASGPVSEGMLRYRVEVGKVDGVGPGNLVGAIANEAGIDSQYIGQISIEHNFTTVDLPEKMSADALKTLEQTWVMGKQLRISRDTGGRSSGGGRSGGARRDKGGYGGKKGGFGKRKGGGKRRD
ncbi:DEAD/DEAH box helicase [Rubripirellula obstinata]|nr:DEAD/DEAH box helicase [Rubripirellula obstinata]